MVPFLAQFAIVARWFPSATSMIAKLLTIAAQLYSTGGFVRLTARFPCLIVSCFVSCKLVAACREEGEKCDVRRFLFLPLK